MLSLTSVTLYNKRFDKNNLPLHQNTGRNSTASLQIHLSCYGVFIVNLEHISLAFLLLTFNT